MPQAGSGQLESFSGRSTGLAVWAMAQTDTHVYWTTFTPGAAMSLHRGPGLAPCEVRREAKSIFKQPDRCAGEIVRLGNALYAVTFSSPPGVAARQRLAHPL